MFDNNERIGTEDPAWHPYPKCTPPDYIEYLVSIKKIYKDCQITDVRRICKYEYDPLRPWSNINDYEKVVAWAYIPEPYQKEKG